MRARLLSLVLFVAACGADVGGPCGLDAPCDEGVCDFTAPDGPVCIEADGDLDGDGLRNDEEFCHHAPGGRFDEDRDGIGDDCDACPIAAPTGNVEPDGDGVDRPCDPDPSVGGDQIVVFEGFGAGELPAGFVATSGWTFVAGEAIAKPADPVLAEELTAPLTLVSAQVNVFAQHRIDQVDTAAGQNLAGVIALDRRPAGGTEISCAGSRAAGADRLLLETDTNVGSMAMADLFSPASLYRLTLAIDRAQAACAMAADDRTGVTQAGTGGELMTEAGVVAKGANVRFQYVLVVGRSGSGGN